ncbi:MAG: hypothetical protein AAF125_27975, partial [Chloroflexota bacterium]
LRLGAPREYFYAVGLPALRDAPEQGLELNVVLGQVRGLLRQLEAGDLDAVIAAQQVPRNNVSTYPSWRSSLCCLARPTLRCHLD